VIMNEQHVCAGFRISIVTYSYGSKAEISAWALLVVKV
jgi:hypothetical protein